MSDVFRNSSERVRLRHEAVAALRAAHWHEEDANATLDNLLDPAVRGPVARYLAEPIEKVRHECPECGYHEESFVATRVEQAKADLAAGRFVELVDLDAAETQARARDLLARLEANLDGWSDVAVAFTRAIGGEPADAGLAFFEGARIALSEPTPSGCPDCGSTEHGNYGHAVESGLDEGVRAVKEIERSGYNPPYPGLVLNDPDAGL